MTKANESAFPHGYYSEMGQVGLTKRELMAIEFHAQLIRFVQRQQMASEDAAALAVRHADALLKELEKKTK